MNTLSKQKFLGLVLEIVFFNKQHVNWKRTKMFLKKGDVQETNDWRTINGLLREIKKKYSFFFTVQTNF